MQAIAEQAQTSKGPSNLGRVYTRIYHHEIHGRGNRSNNNPWGGEVIKNAMLQAGLNTRAELSNLVELPSNELHLEVMRRIIDHPLTRLQLSVAAEMHPESEDRLKEFQTRLVEGELIPFFYGTSGTEYNGKEIVQLMSMVRTYRELPVAGVYFIDPNSHPLLGNVEAVADQLAWMLGGDRYAMFRELEQMYLSGATETENLTFTGDMIPAPDANSVMQFCINLSISLRTTELMMRAASELKSLEGATLSDWMILVQGIMCLDLELETDDDEFNPFLNVSWNIIEDVCIELLEQRFGIEPGSMTLVNYIQFFDEYYPLDSGAIRIWNTPDWQGGELNIYVKKEESGDFYLLLGSGEEEVARVQIHISSGSVFAETAEGNSYGIDHLLYNAQIPVGEIKGNHGGKGYYAILMFLASQGLKHGFFLDDYEAPDAYEPLVQKTLEGDLGTMIPLPAGRTWLVPGRQHYVNENGMDPDSTLGSAEATWLMYENGSAQLMRQFTDPALQPQPGETRAIFHDDRSRSGVGADSVSVSNLGISEFGVQVELGRDTSAKPVQTIYSTPLLEVMQSIEGVVNPDHSEHPVFPELYLLANSLLLSTMLGQDLYRRHFGEVEAKNVELEEVCAGLVSAIADKAGISVPFVAETTNMSVYAEFVSKAESYLYKSFDQFNQSERRMINEAIKLGLHRLALTPIKDYYAEQIVHLREIGEEGERILLANTISQIEIDFMTTVWADEEFSHKKRGKFLKKKAQQLGGGEPSIGIDLNRIEAIQKLYSYCYVAISTGRFHET